MTITRWSEGDPCEVRDYWTSPDGWLSGIVRRAVDSKGGQCLYVRPVGPDGSWAEHDIVVLTWTPDPEQRIRTRSGRGGWRVDDRVQVAIAHASGLGSSQSRWRTGTVTSTGLRDDASEDGEPGERMRVAFDDASVVDSVVLDMADGRTRERVRRLITHVGGVDISSDVAAGAFLAALGEVLPTSASSQTLGEAVKDLSVEQVRHVLYGVARAVTLWDGQRNTVANSAPNPRAQVVKSEESGS